MNYISAIMHLSPRGLSLEFAACFFYFFLAETDEFGPILPLSPFYFYFFHKYRRLTLNNRLIQITRNKDTDVVYIKQVISVALKSSCFFLVFFSFFSSNLDDFVVDLCLTPVGHLMSFWVLMT